jgi:hypothetical protein
MRTFRGVLQADAYAGFNEIYRTGQVVEAPCMAHARRKFHDLSIGKMPSPVGQEALRRIGQLYGIEREIHPDASRTVAGAAEAGQAVVGRAGEVDV